MRRGDVRAALLVLLDEQPHAGYSLMEEMERRSNGAWRPSPGSVYPTLQQLEDEDLVRAEAGEGRTPFTPTDAGKAYVEENREELGEPWAKPAAGVGEERLELRGLVAQIGAAPSRWPPRGTRPRSPVPRSCSRQTRRGLYQILADEPGEHSIRQWVVDFTNPHGACSKMRAGVRVGERARSTRKESHHGC